MQGQSKSIMKQELILDKNLSSKRLQDSSTQIGNASHQKDRGDSKNMVSLISGHKEKEEDDWLSLTD